MEVHAVCVKSEPFVNCLFSKQKTTIIKSVALLVLTKRWNSSTMKLSVIRYKFHHDYCDLSAHNTAK